MLHTLIVEKRSVFRTAFREALVRRYPGMRILETQESGEALRLAEAVRPEFIFLDVRLSEKSGLGLIEGFKAACPASRIVILTDFDLPEYEEAARRGGADRFLSKEALNLKTIAALLDPSPAP